MRHPLVLRWDPTERPLPLRAVQPLPAHSRLSLGTGQPWHDTGPAGEPFDFSWHMRRLLQDVVSRTAEFSRIEVESILISATQARGGRRHGLQARVTPLRFEQGQVTRQRHGVTYQVQRYFLGAREYLYVMTFCLPRYLDQEFDDKLITLFHELHHVHPQCNGALRRHAGRCHMHSASKARYDKHMAELAREYLASRPDPRLHAFLRTNFAQLRSRHGSIHAIMVPRPKLIPIATAQTMAARS